MMTLKEIIEGIEYAIEDIEEQDSVIVREADLHNLLHWVKNRLVELINIYEMEGKN
ncbi:hypothetical protein UFOVP23_22 [uncultured Caudovirales phage]|uniref:Uncharacterized protein n=1 Tax=uncultured Caudovirales phage TaxID=2100421 RepID=A0A6J5T836_9CAUD|nr:hypothetical protein UFOVP23_22 [uncultured Caudovirales phage]